MRLSTLIITIFITLCSYAGSSDKLSELSYLALSNQLKSKDFIRSIKDIDESKLTHIELALFRSLKKRFLKQKYNALEIQELSSMGKEDKLFYLSHKESFDPLLVKLSSNLQRELDNFRRKLDQVSVMGDEGLTQLKSLLSFEPTDLELGDHDYNRTLRLYLICRQERQYPCLLLMKNIWGEFEYEGSNIWSMPALAKSKKNLPYYMVNGNTPTGIHRIDSVMPFADKPKMFGKFRRLILNWIPENTDSTYEKGLLPKTHHDLKWWKQSSIARDAGRKYLRIHGTGRVNNRISAPYFPHVPTLGCISVREGSYSGKVYIDQRVLLNKMIDASELLPVKPSEENLKGILYVFNLDNKKSSVSIKDISSVL